LGNGFGVYRRRDGRVVIKWRDLSDHPRQTTTIQGVREANAFLRRAYREWPGHGTRDTGYTVAELAGEYLRTRERDHDDTGEPGASTLAGDRRAVALITDRWPVTRVEDLHRTDVRAWYSDMRRTGLADNTVRIYASTLRMAYRWGIDADTVPLPAPPVPTVTVANVREGQALDVGTVRAIEAAIPDHYRTMFYTLAFTGMRIGEVCALDVGSFRGRYIVGGSKTDAGKNRPVRIPDWLQTMLEAHTSGRDSGDPLFVNRRGRRVTARPWRRRVWDPATEAAGVPEATPHWLRHTLATRLAEGGHGGWELRSHFGWADQRIADHYIDVASEGVPAIADTLEDHRPALRAVTS
jgi:integrase